MTPEEIANAQEARAVLQHAEYMASSLAYRESLAAAATAAVAASLRGERYVAAQEAMAAELPRSQRLAIIVDSATARLTDRTAAGGAADVPRAVAEALAILAEVERQSAPVFPPSPPPPGGV